MQLSAREMALISMTVVAVVVLGLVVFGIIPLPGFKFAFLSPLLAIMAAMPLTLTRRMGILTLTSLILAAIMSLINPVMGVSIIGAGAATEGLAWLLFRSYTKDGAVLHTSAFYPSVGFLFAATASHYLSGNKLFGALGPGILLFALLSYAFGLLGAHIATRVIAPKLEQLRLLKRAS